MKYTGMTRICTLQANNKKLWNSMRSAELLDAAHNSVQCMTVYFDSILMYWIRGRFCLVSKQFFSHVFVSSERKWFFHCIKCSHFHRTTFQRHYNTLGNIPVSSIFCTVSTVCRFLESVVVWENIYRYTLVLQLKISFRISGNFQVNLVLLLSCLFGSHLFCESHESTKT